MRVNGLLSGVVVATSALFGCAPPTAHPSNTAGTPASSSAVEAPVSSADPCVKDEDCAPVAECHPNRCVSIEHAGTMPKDMMCTMECRAGTVDCGSNHCGCTSAPSGQKLCALLPGAKVH
jgi:hypothetical protein